ncbi:MAG: hypothetical protein WDA16_14230 [Candidatus Thermoplasmatota archaeon]
MRTCEQCGRSFAEVLGAPEQTCPQCGHAHNEAHGSFAAPEPVDPVSAARTALRLFGKHWGALMVLWLPVVLVTLCAQALVTAYDEAQGITPDLGAMSVAQSLQYLGVALPAALVATMVELGMWVVIAAFVLEREGVASPGSLRRVMRSPTKVLGLGMLLTLSFFVGLVLLVVPFFFFLHRFAYAPAAAADGNTVQGALAASSAFAKERRTLGFTALIVLVWIVLVIIGLVLSAPEQALFKLVGVPEAYAEAFAPVIASWPLAPFLPLLPASYWAIARKQPAAAAAVPAPAGAVVPTSAAERFRTTKCPQCETLVPYTATGGPVDITCPVCGRQGRVLS